MPARRTIIFTCDLCGHHDCHEDGMGGPDYQLVRVSDPPRNWLYIEGKYICHQHEIDVKSAVAKTVQFTRKAYT